MAGSVNKVVLIGHLGKDPEVRNFQNGGRVVNLRLATSESYKDRDGNRQERTEWHTVAIFNEKVGEIAEKYLRKGSKVYIEGKLETRKWQDQEGKDRYSTEVVVRNFGGELTLLDSRGDDRGGDRGGDRGDDRGSRGGGRGDDAPRDGGRQGGGSTGRYGAGGPDLDDDIPFFPAIH